MGTWQLRGGQVVTNVHDPAACAGFYCALHHPSVHHMTGWPLVYRSGKMERYCEHGVGHPDPDDLDFIMRTYGVATRESMSVHGCDGCCAGGAILTRDVGWEVGWS